jgi:hypothetical protein
MSAAPRLLLVPVSGPRGMGEYARCLAIADAMRARWPALELRFLLSRDAPYAADCPYPTTLLPSSPTRCTAEVLQAIARFRPGAVLFDNAGRTRQLAAARAAGARVVFVSSRSRQRRKAFRWRWMGMLEEHWISYPAALTGELGWLERAKLRLRGRPVLRFLDAVVAAPDAAAATRLLAAAAAGTGTTPPAREAPAPVDVAPIDVVVVPGGGSAYPDTRITPRHFVDWSLALAAAGRRIVVVGGPAFDVPLAATERLTLLRSLPAATLMALLGRARLVLVNGGDTLAQALTLGRACVAVPIAGDQAARIARAAALGVVVAPGVDGVVAECQRLLDSEAARTALQRRLAALGWRDAMPLVVERLGALLALD